MLSKVFILALTSSPLVAAHGKIAAITGDAGGNTTGLGIQGGIVPGAGRNAETEVDTTIFKSIKAQSDGLGKTKGQGPNTASMLGQAMALSGNTLPQVSADGGSLAGTYHIVTTDGAGPVKAVLDTTGQGAFADGTLMDVTTQVPGKGGNIRPSGQVLRRALYSLGLTKRALNVNKDFPVAVSVPAGTTCTGTVNGVQNVCFAKIANSNPAGPFGGVIAFQMADSSANSTATATSDSSSNSTDAVSNVDDTDDSDDSDDSATATGSASSASSATATASNGKNAKAGTKASKANAAGQANTSEKDVSGKANKRAVRFTA
ncbi:cell surface protein [Niveomyces insectorum RCEF 264]|uniref:Cell surface protein n=1 Tax=Niveomyces insectorum RCEF 264 TaxID=1081102 RepID=A0A167WYW9_9HYPO|nr:cell surface protein [Niveomyces insectorum RCEF 264]